MPNVNRDPVIHIGYHKTATTYLQKSVFSNDQVFDLPWGPDAGKAIEYFVLTHPERFSAQVARDDYLAACDPDPSRVPVLSNEELSSNPMTGRYYIDRVAQRIKDTFPDARILIGIREQNAAIASAYFQYIRQGGTKRLRDLLTPGRPEPGFGPTMRLDHFEYDLALTHFSRLFPRDKICVMPIEMLRDEPDVYRQRLSAFLGVEDTLPMPPKPINARRSDISMSLERRLNAIVSPPTIRAKNYSDNPLLFRMKNKLLRAVDSGLMRLDLSSSVRLDRSVADFIGDYFSSSNGRTAQFIDKDLGQYGYRT